MMSNKKTINKDKGSLSAKRELEEVRDDLRLFNISRDDYSPAINYVWLYMLINIFYRTLHQAKPENEFYGITGYIEALHNESIFNDSEATIALINRIITIDLPKVDILRSHDLPKNHEQLVSDAIEEVVHRKSIHDYRDLSKYHSSVRTDLDESISNQSRLWERIEKIESENKSHKCNIWIAVISISIGFALSAFIGE